jgi:hypothetical protein
MEPCVYLLFIVWISLEAVWKKNNKNTKDLNTQFYRYSTILKVCHRRFRHEGFVSLDSRLLSNCCYAPQAYRLHFQNGYSASQARVRFFRKIPDNIAVSFLPDFESLSKKRVEIISPKVISTILKFREHMEPCVWIFRCSVRISSSCSTFGTCHNALVSNMVIVVNEERIGLRLRQT